MEAHAPDQNPNQLDGPDERRRRILITSGPTQEPIDAVRFIGNRSSGRLGMALANEALRRGWNPTILLGPVSQPAVDSGVRVRRFRTTADLKALLEEEVGQTDLLVMAAAVADYRPIADEINLEGKRRRSKSGLTLKLEATPDLLAGCRRLRRAGQVFVGFALEPAEELMSSARRKLKRKGVDLIVANPLETMDAPGIEATLVGHSGVVARTDGVIPKETFAGWLLDEVSSRWEAIVAAAAAAKP
jgi:phosphopantothenoylcysteine decarboxylase/phosphopantothenate--cysteine ligase